jgi:hypothetical protein
MERKKLMNANYEALALARKRGYLVMEHKNKALCKQLGEWCRGQQLPYVTVTRDGEATARVEMDLTYIPRAWGLMEPFPPYQKYSFMERVMDACERAAGVYGPWFLPGCFTIMDRVPWENAEALAQTFLAIYQQEVVCEDVELPLFPLAVPFKEVRQRLEEAKQRGYAREKKGSHDGLHARYEVWCRAMKAHQISVIQRDTEVAELSAHFASPLAHKTIQSIKMTFTAVGFDLDERGLENATFFLHAKRLGTHKWLPIDIVEFAAEMLVYALEIAEEPSNQKEVVKEGAQRYA